MNNLQAPLIAGRTLEEWNRLWVLVPGGLTFRHRALGTKVGLFRLSLDGQIMVVGTGTDKKGGITKRFSDYRRAGDSGRRHHAGQLVHENLDRLEVEVLITGSDWQARETARKLKGPMIRFHRPVWTVSNAPFMPEAIRTGLAKPTL
jgi:hypothetical protein